MKKNKDKAAELNEQARQAFLQLADAGDMDAIDSLKSLYQFEYLGDRNENSKKQFQSAQARVFAYRQLAAATGDPYSMHILGLTYEYGIYGAQTNRTLAEKFYRAATEKGFDDARKSLEKLLKK